MTKAEDKHFKGNDGVLRNARPAQQRGAGRKSGAPAKADVKK